MEKANFAKEEFGEYVKQFMAEVGLASLDIKGTISTTQNSDKLKDICDRINNHQHYSERIRSYAHQCAKRLIVSFAYLDADVLAHICILWAVSLYVERDGEDSEFLKALQAFERHIVTGKEQEHPVLTALQEVVIGMQDFYGPYGCIMITKSIMEWLASHIVEYRFETQNTKLSKGATQFPAYFRHKSYAADCISHLIFPETMFPEDEYLPVYLPIIPDIGMYKANFNDIISFYKETLAGDDEFNYVCNLANARGISVKEAFQSMCEDTAQRMRNMETVLADHPKVLHALKLHLQNHCTYYFSDPRYRLSEVPVLAELLK